MSYFYKKNTIDQWGPIDARILYPSFWFKPTGMVIHGIRWPHLIGLYDHDRLTFYWEKELMEKYGYEAIEKWILPEKKRKIIWNEYKKIISNISVAAKRLQKTNITNKKILKQTTKEWYNHLIPFWRLSLIYEIANFSAPKYLANLLKRDGVDVKKIDKIVEVLLTPEDLSFHQQNELELLKLYFSKKNIKASSVALKNFEKKWNWVDNSYYQIYYIGAGEWFARLKSYNKKKAKSIYDNLSYYKNRVIKNKADIINKYNLSKNYLNISQALSFSLWWQDDRKAKSWWAHSSFDKILDSLAVFYHVKKSDLLYYTAEEWLDLGLKGNKIGQIDLKKRKGYFIFLIKNANYQLIFGKKAKKFFNPILKQIDSQQNNKKIVGVVANRSNKKITGTVRVVFSPRQLKKIKPSEILVAPMTSPDYIHLMRQAKAVVTDIGGLMSHAAVVSRELGKICIIGTKIATKKLKNGDIIQIDANTGEIKIIK